ncbi:hypothetical protein [Kytococcus aerolatus]|nr:hypothetical protein [Kytococcus aerolatus]
MSDNAVETTAAASAVAASAEATGATQATDDGLPRERRLSPLAHALVFVLLGMILSAVLVGIWPLMEILANDVPTPHPAG